jgi:hypothetical protein
VLSPTVSSRLISSSLPSTPLNELDPLGLFSQYSFGNNIDKNKNEVHSNSQSRDEADVQVDKNISKYNSNNNNNNISNSNIELKIVNKSIDSSAIDDNIVKKTRKADF